MSATTKIMELVTTYGQEIKDFGYSDKADDLLMEIRVAIESPIAALEREQELTAEHRCVQAELWKRLADIRPVAWRAWNSQYHCYDYYEIADPDPLGREDKELLGVIKDDSD